MKRLPHIALLALSLWMSACSNDRLIEVELPEYVSEPVVECFLEPGKPFRLVLWESVGYFDEPSLPQIENALVIIRHPQGVDTLQYNPLGFVGDKFYNYQSTTLVPEVYNEPFELYVRDSLGRELTATTMLVPPVPIDTLEYELNNENKALVRAIWQDDPSGPNYYRFVLHENQLNGGGFQFAFLLDDRVGNGEEFIASSFYGRDLGDTAIVTLYTLDYDYWYYLTTVDEAEGANGNPFAQPASVASNVEGGIGIFTGISYDRKSILIE